MRAEAARVHVDLTLALEQALRRLLGERERRGGFKGQYLRGSHEDNIPMEKSWSERVKRVKHKTFVLTQEEYY